MKKFAFMIVASACLASHADAQLVVRQRVLYSEPICQGGSCAVAFDLAPVSFELPPVAMIGVDEPPPLPAKSAPAKSVPAPTASPQSTTVIRALPPVVSYAGPPVSYAAPSVTYSAPTAVTYSAPLVSHAAPSVAYAAPASRFKLKLKMRSGFLGGICAGGRCGP